MRCRISITIDMSETAAAWHRVLSAFDDWIAYESTEFMPWTTYFSMDSLRDLTNQERVGWITNMIDDVIPGRVDMCRAAGVALEDFLPHMPDEAAIETVRSMIELNDRVESMMLSMSDTFSIMLDEYKEGGLDNIVGQLGDLADTEEDIRHHMSLYSKGFARLKKLGLDVPSEME